MKKIGRKSKYDMKIVSDPDENVRRKDWIAMRWFIRRSLFAEANIMRERVKGWNSEGPA